jgi:hypothetical protein
MCWSATEDVHQGRNWLHKYHVDLETKRYKIPDDCKIFDFTGKHPKVMADHPYFTANIFNDEGIVFDKE